jgi:Ion channel
MLLVALTSILLIALTSLIQHEVIHGLTVRMPELGLPARVKFLIVVFAALLSHMTQIALYGLAMYLLVNHANTGLLEGPDGPALSSCMFFSAESYTSLGFGDIKPTGPIRLITGVEALNGLVMIGWTACYLFMEAERIWAAERQS